LQGDPDIYVWQMGADMPLMVSDLFRGTDEVMITAPADTLYQVEVHGFMDFYMDFYR
jgi:hypothetical protein